MRTVLKLRAITNNQSIPDIETFFIAKMAISFFPDARLKIILKFFQRRRYISKDRKNRNCSPHIAIEISVRTTPICTQKTIGAVMGYGHNADTYPAKDSFERSKVRHNGPVKFNHFRKIIA